MAATRENTLQYEEALCNRCGMCATVCPHRVFQIEGRKARLVDRSACMECGACQLNCESGAIKVDNDVGCASAMIMAALKRSGKASCCC